MPDMRSFAHALIQADELGVSIGVILRIQSDQMRQQLRPRRAPAQRGSRQDARPLMLFIFPAVFIVLLTTSSHVWLTCSRSRHAY